MTEWRSLRFLLEQLVNYFFCSITVTVKIFSYRTTVIHLIFPEPYSSCLSKGLTTFKAEKYLPGIPLSAVRKVLTRSKAWAPIKKSGRT